jgi:hypothetical protein
MEKSIRRINSKMRKQNRKYTKAIRTNKINKSSKKKNKVVTETTRKEQIKSAMYGIALNIGFYIMLYYFIYKTLYI